MPKLTSEKHLLAPKSLDARYRERDSALDRVIALAEQGEAKDTDELSKALDVLVLAHMAATFEWANGSLTE